MVNPVLLQLIYFREKTRLRYTYIVGLHIYMQSTDTETLHDDFPTHMAGNLLEYVLLVKDSLGIVEFFVEGIELTPDLRLGTVPTRNSTQQHMLCHSMAVAIVVSAACRCCQWARTALRATGCAGSRTTSGRAQRCSSSRARPRWARGSHALRWMCT